MIKYSINPAHDNTDAQPTILEILNTSEFRESRQNAPYYRDILRNLDSIRYCKADLSKNCIVGTFRIPQKNEHHSAFLTFVFYMTENVLIFIEDTGNLQILIEKGLNMLHDFHTSDQFLLQLMEQLIEDDVLYLSQLENELEKMEDTLSHQTPHNFFLLLTRYRRRLSEMNAYYAQLADIGELMQSQTCFPIIQNPEAWNKYTRRAERLQNHVQLLRENIIQLRELYQSRQDAQQSKIMGILTIVTTIFLPLTLLTGWYGMNFAYMPEIHWKYGYATVAIIAVIIVVLEILFFKKKKFF